MKYFRHKGLDYHCSDIFNWMAIDRDGAVFLYEKEPFYRDRYWTSGHTDSYDYRVYTGLIKPCNYWRASLLKL